MYVRSLHRGFLRLRPPHNTHPSRVVVLAAGVRRVAERRRSPAMPLRASSSFLHDHDGLLVIGLTNLVAASCFLLFLLRIRGPGLRGRLSRADEQPQRSDDREGVISLVPLDSPRTPTRRPKSEPRLLERSPWTPSSIALLRRAGGWPSSWRRQPPQKIDKWIVGRPQFHIAGDGGWLNDPQPFFDSPTKTLHVFFQAIASKPHWCAASPPSCLETQSYRPPPRPLRRQGLWHHLGALRECRRWSDVAPSACRPEPLPQLSR